MLEMYGQPQANIGDLLMALSPKSKALALIAVGIGCSIASLFTFALGWDRTSEEPGFATVLLGSGVLFAVASLVLFAIGWDARNNLLRAGAVSGHLIKPPLHFDVCNDIVATLRSQDNQVQMPAQLSTDGAFVVSGVRDGVWRLQVSSSWYQLYEKDVRLSQRERVNLGDIQLRFAINKVWTRELISQTVRNSLARSEPLIGQIMDYCRDTQNREWAVGFVSKDFQNRRSILVKSQGEWVDRVVPQFSNAERGTVVRSLKDGSIIVGSLGAGAVSSADGVVWRSMQLPEEMDSVTALLQLPDETLLAGAWVWRRGAPTTSHVVKFKTASDVGQSAFTLNSSHITELFATSSGRILMGLWEKEPTILYSDDYGTTWTKTRMPSQLRGSVTSGRFFEPKHNILLACLNSFAEGRAILSIDGGVSWNLAQGADALGPISGFAANEDCCLCFAGATTVIKPSMVLTSLDFGRSWKRFMDVTPRMSHSNGFSKHGTFVSLFGSNGIDTANVLDLTPKRFVRPLTQST